MRDWIGAVLLLLLAAASAAAAPPDADVEAVARDVFASGEYQTRIPNIDPPRRADEPRRSERRWTGEPGSGRRADAPERSPSPRGDTDLAPLAKALFYLVVGVAAVALAVVLVRWLAQSRQENVRAAESAPAPAAGPAPPPPLAEHERLAREERFDEAVHVLLLHALAPLRPHFSDALTSREILARVELPADAGEALRGLVGAVERSHFGGVPAGRDVYEECVRRFRAVEAALLSRTKAAAA